MQKRLKVAACQFPVSADISKNSKYIQRFMRAAAAEAVDLIQFPESALCGYLGTDFCSFDAFDWSLLDSETKTIRDLASELELWTVVGSCHDVGGGYRPTNCLYVISDSGGVRTRYDKRRLYGREADHFSAGSDGATFTLRGYRIGLLVCYDSCFPELYESYHAQGVSILLHSYYNARSRAKGPGVLDELMVSQLRVRASDHQMWIIAANSSARHSRLAACIARPDGSVVSHRRHVAGIVCHSFPDVEASAHLRKEQGLIARARVCADVSNAVVPPAIH